MNNIFDKCLFNGDKFMTKLRLRGLNHSACGPFTKHRESIQKFREADDLEYIYKNELDYEIAINLKYDGYERGLMCVVYNFF